MILSARSRAATAEAVAAGVLLTALVAVPAPAAHAAPSVTGWDGDPTFAAALGTGPAGGGATGTLASVIELADGDLLVSGLFTSFDGTPAPSLVRLNPDGTRDTDTAFNTTLSTVGGPSTPGNAASRVAEVAELPDGDLVAGGATRTSRASRHTTSCG